VAELSFAKMHGLGNDFVIVDDRDEQWDFDPDAIRFLCDRHFGIGADGLILVRLATVPGADFQMLYHNADGTPAEMCGNGIRCFAKYLVDRGLVEGEGLAVQTLGGIKDIHVVRGEDEKLATARVDMGTPSLTPADIPVDLPGTQIFECQIETSEGLFKISAVSMGNPHAVVWVDDVDAVDIEAIGPAIETASVFPNKTNVEFAQLTGVDDHVKARVWERGVGETLACGTGACAVAVLATLSCRSGRKTTVELPGGELVIGWAPDDHVFLTGPAEEVFAGVLQIADEE
jgi:diaminopimelate epimerase